MHMQISSSSLPEICSANNDGSYAVLLPALPDLKLIVTGAWLVPTKADQNTATL